MTHGLARQRPSFAKGPLCWSSLALWVIGNIGCGGDKRAGRQGKKRRPPVVEVIPATRTTLRDRLALTGAVEPTRFARMASPAEGPIIACKVREGDRVRAGALLVRLGRTRGDAATASAARAALAREKVELGRVKRLVAKGALPGEELDKARIKVSAAAAALARVSERLGDYRVVAPWRGVVSRVRVAVGDFVSARAPLVELFDPASLVLRFHVPEQQAARVSTSATFTARLDAYPGRTFTGKITRVYPEIDRQTHTRTVEGVLAEKVSLAPGMFARLELVLSIATDALSVPVTAILSRGKASVVLVVTADGRVRRRKVRTGIEDAGRVEIRSGLKAGERVAVAGHSRLRDGVLVRLAKTPAPRRRSGSRAGAARPMRPPVPKAPR